MYDFDNTDRDRTCPRGRIPLRAPPAVVDGYVRPASVAGSGPTRPQNAVLPSRRIHQRDPGPRVLDDDRHGGAHLSTGFDKHETASFSLASSSRSVRPATPRPPVWLFTGRRIARSARGHAYATIPTARTPPDPVARPPAGRSVAGRTTADAPVASMTALQDITEYYTSSGGSPRTTGWTEIRQAPVRNGRGSARLAFCTGSEPEVRAREFVLAAEDVELGFPSARMYT